MTFACTTCGRLCSADGAVNAGRTMFCGGCGHAMIFDGGQVRDLSAYELDSEANVDVIHNLRATQQEFVHEKGWWG
jgi:hypothetical protein